MKENITIKGLDQFEDDEISKINEQNESRFSDVVEILQSLKNPGSVNLMDALKVYINFIKIYIILKILFRIEILSAFLFNLEKLILMIFCN